MKVREFSDTEETRKRIYEAIESGFKKSFPREGRFVRLRVEDVKMPDKFFSKAVQKKHILHDRDLTVPVKGSLILEDKESGKVLGKKTMSIGHMPYLTPRRGTFIGNGTEFSVANQKRLMPGVYTRVTAKNDVESQFNVAGKMGFRVNMEPKTGLFRMNVGNNKLKLYPILRALNIPDAEIEKTWGPKLLDVNRTDDKTHVHKLYKKLSGYQYQSGLSVEEQGREIARELDGLKLSPEVTEDTLGVKADKVSPQLILKSTRKILDVTQGKKDPDDRDSLRFGTFEGVEDFVRERIEKDSGKLTRRLLNKLDRDKTLEKIQPGVFSKYFKQIVRGDDRAFPLEEINPIQLYDNMHRSIITGEGGIGSIDTVSMEARNVNPSQFGFIDPFRGPESDKIGIDTRVAINTYKGDDKKIYSKFYHAKTRKPILLSPAEVHRKTVSFPGEIDRKAKSIRVMKNGEITYANKKDVDFFLKDGDEMYSTYTVMVPFHSSVSGNRLLMAGKAMSDTLPFAKPEPPLVRSRKGEGEDFETHFGRTLAESSPISGTVKKISKNEMVIEGDDGERVTVDLYHHFPLSRKTHITNVPVVSPGDKVKKGDILAKSNFTDDNGTLAAGKHLLSAFIPFKGLTFEDGIVISESAAEKLTTEQMYKYEVPLDKDVKLSRKDYVSLFPLTYKKEQTQKIDDSGLPKPGTKLMPGDPIALSARRRTLSARDIALGNIHKTLKNTFEDTSQDWSHEEEGEVTDVVITPKKAKIYIKTRTPAKVGDKLSGRYGNKGVVSAIVPDEEMPEVKRTGEKLEMALNSMGVVSRINPAQVVEGLLGKIGKEKGIHYKVPGFYEGKITDIAKKELQKHKMPDEEIVVDPISKRNIKAMVTYPYFYRPSKLAESMSSTRDFGVYTSNMQPAKGSDKELQAKKIGTMEMAALLGHGAKANLKDITLVKGQKNDTYWRNLKLGYPLPSPDVPFVFNKFNALLRGAGINVEKRGDVFKIMPLTDKEISRLSQGEIRNFRTLSARNLEPEKGGLFDKGLTGGPAGKFWTHIDLAEPLPNPIMEKPIRTILGLNEKEYRKVLAGGELPEEIFEKASQPKLRGGEAIRHALSRIDLDKEIERIDSSLPSMTKTKKDQALKKLRYLKGIKNTGLHPKDLVMTKYPILPPIFRPITAIQGSNTLTISDPNKLYRDLIHSNDILKDLKGKLPDEELSEEKMNLYDTLKGTVGLGKHVNPELEMSGVKSFMKKIVGQNPKTSFFFEKVISKSQDLVGRGVAVPDSSLGLNEIGIPKKMAWKLYKPFIMKHMITRGIPALRADEEIKKETPIAFSALEASMRDRPVLMNRAPTLHKFSIMAFYPKLRSDDAIGTSPLITGPFGLDHDGDALQIHVPVSEEARKEAIEKMLPSENFQSLKTYEAHYMPTQEDNYGLFIASTRKKKKPPVKVKNMEHLDRELKAGRLNFDDPIVLMEE